MSQQKPRSPAPAASRRRFLRQLLTGAAYAAPVVAAMSVRQVHAAQATAPGMMFMFMMISP